MSHKHIFFLTINIFMFNYSLHSQSDKYFIYFNKNTITLDVPGRPPIGVSKLKWEVEREVIQEEMNQFRDQKEKEIYDLVRKLHDCLRIISDKNKDTTILQAAKDIAIDIFNVYDNPDAKGRGNFFGYTLTGKFKPTESYIKIDNYIDRLYNLSRKNNIIFSICWSIPEYNIKKRIDTLENYSSKAFSELNTSDSIKRYHKIYRMTLPVLEKIIIKNSSGRNVFSKNTCKKITCELRCYELKYPNQENSQTRSFYWEAALVRVEKDNLKQCKVLEKIICTQN